ncbi:MAG: HD domain-containing phosphohydrolase [Planctomycetota bacterium]
MCELDARLEAAPGLLGLVDALATACAHAPLYPATHPRVLEPICELEHKIEEVLGASGEVALELAFCDDFLVVDGEPLAGASLSVGRVAKRLRDIGSGGLRFARSVDSHELSALVSLLGRRNRLLLEDARTLLVRKGVRSAEILGPFVAAGERDARLSQMKIPVTVYQSVFGQLEEFTLQLSHGRETDMDAVHHDIDRVLQLLISDPIAALNVARYEQYDAFTFGHSVRSSILALNFGHFLGLTEEEVLRLGTATLLHDVGKACVPFELLHATGKLSAEDREEIEKHAQLGANMLLELSSPDPWVVVAAFAHHRKPDGSGYPRSIGSSVPGALAQMVKLCDVYEALTANRPYKTAMTPMQAYQVMLGMRDHFEPGLLKAFIHAQGLYPLGTEVELETGEIAVVVEHTGFIRRPKVQLVRNRDGDLMSEEDREILCLADDHSSIAQGRHETPLESV